MILRVGWLPTRPARGLPFAATTLAAVYGAAAEWDSLPFAMGFHDERDFDAMDSQSEKWRSHGEEMDSRDAKGYEFEHHHQKTSAAVSWGFLS